MARSMRWGLSALSLAVVVIAGRVVSCGGFDPQAGNHDRSTPRAAALVAADVCLDGDPLCTPTGAHARHGAFACSVCHKVAGRLAFDRSGPAYGAGLPTPAFDAVAKTCSNIACHGVPQGTFSYWFPGGDGEPELITITYGGPGGGSPNWYATGGATCSACHGDPPANGTWHSGYHGNQLPTGPLNQCQYCHPDASSPGNAVGDTITNPALHRNGVLDILPKFTSACFNCH